MTVSSDPVVTGKGLPMLHETLAAVFRTSPVGRDEWAEALGVSEMAISQWLNGDVLPDADHLDALRVLIAADDRLSVELRKEFETVLDRPIRVAVLRPSHTLGPTLRHYLVRPRMEAAMKLVATLPPDEQVEVLIELGSEVLRRRAKP